MFYWHFPKNLDGLSDIFGCQIGSHYQKGLIDAPSKASFHAALSKMETWNNLECSCFDLTTHPYSLIGLLSTNQMTWLIV